LFLRCWSSKPSSRNRQGVDTTDADAEARLTAQPFVKTRLETGEWDPERTNPLYRPKFRSSARIISADDFANRPTVGVSSEFESFQDAMITFSWLSQNDQRLIYQLYLDLMVSAESSDAGRTSHEYVMRVIAQKFNVTAERVAAVVQLQHNEQQMLLQNPDAELCTELADRMDRLIQQEIDDAYQTFNLKKPETFTEDPVGVDSWKEPKKWVIVDDVFDVDKMAEDAIIREEREARLIIDGHVYIEDLDENATPVPLDKDCRYLLKQKDSIQKRMSEEEARVLSERAKKTACEPVWPTQNGKGETRERWKFVAQTGTYSRIRRVTTVRLFLASIDMLVFVESYLFS
jgi:Eukaryotic mitochondrial regulator protein